MRTTRTISLVIAIVIAGICQESSLIAGSGKCCGYTEDFQPRCCRPQVVRPNRFHFNPRRLGCVKPDCCDQLSAPANCCCPIVPAPSVCDNVCLPVACDTSCCPNSTPAELARLIHLSQTACHSWQRRDAVHKLSDKYECRCHPEVMPALLFALRDCDERVRSKAADEIGDQLRANPRCCDCTVFNALTFALGDCDRFVRRQAEEALVAAGYEVVDGSCVPRGADCCHTVAVPFESASQVVPTGINQPAGTSPASPPSSGSPSIPISPTQDNFVAPPPAESPIPGALFDQNLRTQTDAPLPASTNTLSETPVAAKPDAQGPKTTRRQPLRDWIRDRG